MNKIKNWLKFKLRKFLDVESLENNYIQYTLSNDKTVENIKQNLSGIRNSNKLDHEHFYDRFVHNEKAIQIFDNTLKNVIHIGTDVRVNHSDREHSWAVVCIEGKVNIVKFVDLNRNDSRYILDFLKQFESGRHCIDTPHKEFFYDGLFKF